MKLTEFAAAVGSQVENLAEDFEIRGITTLETAGEHDVTFVSGDKYLARAAESRAGAVIVPSGSALPGRATIAVREPWAAVLHLLSHFHPPLQSVYFRGVHPSAVVDPSAELAAGVIVGPCAVVGPRTRIGERVVIGPNCVVGPDCTIGEDTVLHASVTIAHGCVIGRRVGIHPGTVIGADGFKYEVIGGRLTKIPQVGNVVLEDDVEIGANSCVDRASYTETRIGAGTKIDNLVQIGHNVTIGRAGIVVSQTGVAGSTHIGDGCILAAAVGIADNVTIGDRVTILARSGVKDDIPDGSVVLGAPARPVREQARIMAAEARLPDMLKEIGRLRAELDELKARVK